MTVRSPICHARACGRWTLVLGFSLALLLGSAGARGLWASSAATEAARSLDAHVGEAGGPRAAPAGASASYAWPVKPFGRAHPLRSTFGEPRTWFDGPPVRSILYGGTGSFSFHEGVDIVVPDGTPVYPVRSGVVTLSKACKVFVDAGDGQSHQYWHILPEVRAGERVVAFTTILGRVRRSYGHVHLTEALGGRPVNPLARGHLTPYDDRTAPELGTIRFSRAGGRGELLPELVRDRIELGVAVSDRPDPAGPGMWQDLPTAPALVSWRVERASDSTVVVRERTAFDVRARIPQPREFWRYYLRGTRQNMTTFKLHRYWRQPGVFVFRLGVLDTARLADGIYAVVATASDIRGNRGVARATFTIFNRPGWPPKTPQA